MEKNTLHTLSAVPLLAALAQESRLAVFRLLVQRGPEGMPAGQIASHLGIAANTLSFHLKELSRVGLLQSRSQGRFVHYSADFALMRQLLVFLTQNCCQGQGCAESADSVLLAACSVNDDGRDQAAHS